MLTCCIAVCKFKPTGYAAEHGGISHHFKVNGWEAGSEAQKTGSNQYKIRESDMAPMIRAVGTLPIPAS
jgi:hypothetical protein